MQLADAEIKSQKTFDLSSVSKGKKNSKSPSHNGWKYPENVSYLLWKIQIFVPNWDKIGSVDWILILIFRPKIKITLTEFMYKMRCFSEFPNTLLSSATSSSQNLQCLI